MQVPGLTHQGHHRGICMQEQLEAGVLSRLGRGFPSHTEGDDLGLPLLEFFDLLEEIGIPGIGTREPPLDVINTYFRKSIRHAELVFEGQGNVLRLTPVPQGRVID